jgi:ribulose-bisphosphate carboxylase large chain
MKTVKNLRLNDIHLPEKYIHSFSGPKYGIEGIRKIMKIKQRPLVGTIIKPKLGLRTEDHAKVAFEAWIGGCDIVKDDENLTSQYFNPFEKRIRETLKMRNRAEKETGEKKIYMPNITAETNEMIKRARFVKKQGGEYIMIDIITCGFSSLQTICDEEMIVHAHRAMHAAITRNQKHGISMKTIAKLSRLAGVDQLHIGTMIGKMEGTDTKDVREACIEKIPLKPVFPVCSGGLNPKHVPELVKMLGKDIIIQMGGGVHGHPNGTESGAKAARQAVDAVMKKIPLKEYAKNHSELEKALKLWR